MLTAEQWETADGKGRISHDSKTFKQQMYRDANLRLYAQDKGIELIEVPYLFRNNVGDFLDHFFRA